MSLFDTKFQKYCLSKEEKHLNTCSVRVIVTTICKMACWYCTFHHRAEGNSPKMVNQDLWEKILEYIELQNKEYVSMTFTGGEPSSHPKLREYIHQLKELYKDKIHIQVNTNIGFPLSFYERHFTKEPIELLISYHSRHVPDVEEFFDKVRYLEQFHKIKVHLMLEKDNQEKIKEVYLKYSKEEFLNPKTHIEIVPIDQFSGEYSFKDIDWYHKEDKDRGYILKVKDTAGVIPKDEDGDWMFHRDFKGMLCSGESIITADGDVYHCYQDLNKNKNKKLNLLTDDLIKTGFKICEHSRCTDGFTFPKYSVKYYNEVKNAKENGSNS